MSSLTILYKNASRSGNYVQVVVRALPAAAEAEAMSIADAVAAHRDKDCILPHGMTGATPAVVPCRLVVHVCDNQGVPCAPAARHIAPEIYVRTDRGAASAFNEAACYLLPVASGADAPLLQLQVATRERSNVMRAAMCLSFEPLGSGGSSSSSGVGAVARSDVLLVLSKPPAGQRQPFARVVPKAEAPAGAPLEEGARCAPSKWLSTIKADTHVLVPTAAVERPVTWVVHALGNYRKSPPAAAVAPSAKKPRLLPAAAAAAQGSDDLRVSELQEALAEAQQKLAAVESQRDGYARALRLLAKSSE